MYIYLKKITLNAIPSLFVVLSILFTLNREVTVATGFQNTNAISVNSSAEINITDGIISAEIKKIPLKDVLEKLEKEYGLSYEAADMILKREVSVKFDNLPLKKGINKIVFPLSYSIVYGEKDKPEKLCVFGIQLEKAEEGNLPTRFTPSDYKPLPQYNPHEVDIDSFLTPSQDYKPLPPHTPKEIASSPFVETPPDYKPLPPFTPCKETIGVSAMPESGT